MNTNKRAAIAKGEKAEHLFVKQFGGKRATDMATQYKDIDIIHKQGTFSVKEQVWSSGKYGGITVEMFMEDAEGNRMDGNAKVCEADFYAWGITHNGSAHWLMIKPSALLRLIEEKGYPLKTTMASTTAQNASQGRKYTKAHIHAVPLKDILSELTEGSDYRLKEMTV